ncbi:hypothetical protein ACQKWADRAFT_304191 [Trichoderma austrokoningii]
MSRLIDRLPMPEKIKENKVIVLSRSRVGTFSLYQGLQILGYKPYHMYEVVTNGVPHLQLFEEAIRCKYSGKGKPYGKAEFDKWLANYDAIVEIPQFFIEEFTEYYPNAKFILVERDVDAWERSFNNTVKAVFNACRSFPMNVVQYTDRYISGFVTLHITFEDAMFHNKGIAKGMEEAKRDTIADGIKAKRLAPKGRLLACTLEGGFGWEQICPFLEKDIPETPYPRGNAPAQFQELLSKIIDPRMKSSFMKIFGTLLLPVISIGLWSYMKRQ